MNLTTELLLLLIAKPTKKTSSKEDAVSDLWSWHENEKMPRYIRRLSLYGRGRAATTWRRKKWVFGILGIQDERRHPVLRLVKRRGRQNLVPIVVKHVRPGTTIIRDEWRAFRGALSAMGYTHFRVNHRQWFVDPHSGAHTQHLERAWLKYKITIWRLRGNRREKILKSLNGLAGWLTHTVRVPLVDC